jgi:hypothetical protein
MRRLSKHRNTPVISYIIRQLSNGQIPYIFGQISHKTRILIRERIIKSYSKIALPGSENDA